jgi:UDP-glucuronate 4-epimerase
MGTILVTGCAGFIGFHLTKRLLERGDRVLGLDSLNEYYDPSLKQARRARLMNYPSFRFVKMDLADRGAIAQLFAEQKFDCVVNLAAQAGVRYSVTHPHSYVDSNLLGFANLLEGCRHAGVQHLVYASSSSVYGGNTKMPFSVHDRVDQPVSLYAATKRANELMAHVYAHLFGLPCTGLRFFTVYGPWGRPDMVPFVFTRPILDGKPIDVFNYGQMLRDFTYVDDVIECVVRVMGKIPQPDCGAGGDSADDSPISAPWRIYNIGNSKPVELKRVIEILEAKLGKKAQMNFLPMQPGDVVATYADVGDLVRDIAFAPQTPIEDGIERFVEWYRDYYRV